MKGTQIYALGRDRYWLEAIGQVASERITIHSILCPEHIPECLERLPAADAKALLLLDATNQADVARTVRYLRLGGWQYIVVVAADPSWKEARNVLRPGLAYDYWDKSYNVPAIRSYVDNCLAELEGNDHNRPLI